MAETLGSAAGRGGCMYCRWFDDHLRCTHAAYPVPLNWMYARNDIERCGNAGRLWEPRLVLSPSPRMDREDRV
jgi:hypothetical protein